MSGSTPRIDVWPAVAHLLVAAGAMMAGAQALADLAFTSTPPTSAAVGRAYAYRMTAVDVDRDDDDDDGRRIEYTARALPGWLEFDGNDTIFGTPGPKDVGAHRVKLRARIRRDRVDQDFTIDVAPAPSGMPAEGADLAASVSVNATSASVGDSLTWRVTARNLSDADVANIVLETAFSGDARFSLDDVDDSDCAIEPRGDRTSVVCRWSPLTSGRSKSAGITGHATQTGDILATARVSIVDAVPKDRNPANDEASVVVKVTNGEPQPDGDAPVLTLNGASSISVTVGETFEDPGATAVDDIDGDLTKTILVDNPVDTKVIGRYSVTYEVVDSAGNVSTATRTVEVVPLPPGGGGGGGAVGLGLLLPLLFSVLFAGHAGRAPPRVRAR